MLCSHGQSGGKHESPQFWVCGNPCILEREKIPTEVIRDRAECKPVYQILRKLWFRLNNFRSWTSLNPRPHFVLTSFWGALTPDATFARLSVSIDCQDSRSSGTILTDLRHPPIAIPMRGNCPHTVERTVVHRLYRSQNQHVEATRTGAKEAQNPSRHTCQCQWDNNTRQHLTALYHAHLNTTIVSLRN